MGIIIYLASIGAISPMILTSKLAKHPVSTNHCICTSSLSWLDTFIYVTILDCCISFLPMIIIVTVQILSYKELQKSARQCRASSNRDRYVKKVFRTFVIIVVTFFVLATPFCILELLVFWTGPSVVPSNANLYRSFILLLSINSCANPLIYGRIHRTLFKLIKCNFRDERVARIAAIDLNVKNHHGVP